MSFRTVVPFVLLAAACTTEATISPGEPGGSTTLGRGLNAGASIHLRSINGQYLVAEGGGGGALNANRPTAGAWETFTLTGGFPNVQLRTSDGLHFVQATLGGGHGVTAATTNDGAWETFTLEKLGGGPITDGDSVALRCSTGQYVVAELGGNAAVGCNRGGIGAWETFRLEVAGSGSVAPPTGGVLPEDTVLVPPQPNGPVLGTVTGYEMNSHCPFADPSRCELPMYRTYDRDTNAWWDVLVQELLHSRVNVVMAHGRGCYDPASGTSGNGNMCPRLLSRLVAAIDRAGARDVLRLGMFDDTGAYQGTRNAVENRPDATRFDLSDHTSWRFFWDHNMKIWFDTVPRDLWYRLDGKPVIAFWTLSSYFFSGQRNHASLMLRDLKAKFEARYGETPAFILDGTWVSEDPSITPADAVGLNDWFDPSQKNYTFRTWGGAKWGATVPAFRDPDTNPGCGAPCREYGRRDGQSLRDAFTAGASAKFILLEGWTDVAESAGYYRSDAWRFPNQYIEVVRQTADPGTSTVRLEAEAADAFADFSSGNLGGAYRGGDLDVGDLPGPNGGWHVGWTEAGEWLRFQEVAHACGTYRYTLNVATPLDGQRVKLRVGGQDLGEVALPNTGGWQRYQTVHLGERKVPAGKHDVTLELTTGGANVDWVFVRKSSGVCN